jgi:hypothetical protein
MNEAEEILRDELESFDPKYQQNYKTLRDAAIAAGVYALQAYADFLDTPEGAKLEESLQGIHDYQADNENRRALREAELRLTPSGRKWLNGGK